MQGPAAGEATALGRSNRPPEPDRVVHRGLAWVRSWGEVLGGPGLVLMGFLVVAVAPALFTPYELTPCLLSESLQTPSLQHPFGTDLFGCDYYTRTLYGARTSMLIGGVVIAGSMVIATLLGAVAAWSGGWVDQCISRSADVLFAVPIVFTALVLFGLTDERTMLQVIVVLTLFAWPPMVRVVRGAVRERMQEEHVLAAMAQGARSRYVIRRHLLPFAMRPMAVFALPYMATIISLEAILSFVGAGLQLPNVSWGLMLANLGSRLVGLRVADAPHPVIPGVALSLLVWALVEVGNRFREATSAEGTTVS